MRSAVQFGQKLLVVHCYCAWRNRPTHLNCFLSAEIPTHCHQMAEPNVRKNPKNVRTMRTSIAGVEFSVAEGHAHYWRQLAVGAWEKETFAIFAEHINKKTTVVDIGAFIGATALYAAYLGRRVYAFEPDPVA